MTTFCLHVLCARGTLDKTGGIARQAQTGSGRVHGDPQLKTVRREPVRRGRCPCVRRRGVVCCWSGAPGALPPQESLLAVRPDANRAMAGGCASMGSSAACRDCGRRPVTGKCGLVVGVPGAGRRIVPYGIDQRRVRELPKLLRRAPPFTGPSRRPRAWGRLCGARRGCICRRCCERPSCPPRSSRGLRRCTGRPCTQPSRPGSARRGRAGRGSVARSRGEGLRAERVEMGSVTSRRKRGAGKAGKEGASEGKIRGYGDRGDQTKPAPKGGSLSLIKTYFGHHVKGVCVEEWRQREGE
jgi:hypothetical protein